ncbi:MAG TPA: IS200/IS605 family transposase [Candidatus Hydrogenedentes bacterium]|mgnify:CR=1 FL=1|nr:IS200/IS605 family transposase [Candidatus Hydrogenedentota bacterium]
MPQSYCNLTYHFVFSTKERKPWLNAEIRRRMYDYLGGTLRSLAGTTLAINGTSDHVHILARLRQDSAVSDVLRKLKTSSSKWAHATFPDVKEFAWQTGYGAFTVSKSRIKSVREYVENQERHHETRSFKEEFVALLDAHGIDHDKARLWGKE